MKFYAVLGANWGDEGKGLVTDYLCAKAFSLNVLMNGGVQRTHTVVVDGKRHVFRHFGSGTLAGADTYCHKDFILNPYMFVKEYKELFEIHRNIGKHLFLWHQDCRWSTPYDTFLNRIIVESKGVHNSGGWGIWETIQRYSRGPKLLFSDFCEASLENKQHFLNECRYWLYSRLKEEKVTPSQDWIDIIESKNLEQNFISDCIFMYQRGNIVDSIYPSISGYQQVVFENSSGLQLNDRGEDDPDRAPFHTGLRNIVEFVAEYTSEWDLMSTLEAIYVTRSYFTRHGDGILPGENSNSSFGEIIDNTNLLNEWQGSMRYAPLIPDLVSTTIWSDFRQSLKVANLILDSGIKANLRLAVTHVDEIIAPEEIYNISENPLIFASSERCVELS